MIKPLYRALVIAACLCPLTASAAEQQTDTLFRPLVKSHQLKRDGSNLLVEFSLNLADYKVKANEAVLLTPALITDKDTLILPALGIYGRQRWIQYTREYNRLSGKSETTYKASKTPDSYDFHQFVEYKPWMDGAKLRLHRGNYGCCKKLLAEDTTTLDQYYAPIVFPTAGMMKYMRPAATGEKTREISGTAWVQFPVDQTVIYPERYNNPTELGKIRATIDTLRMDADVTLSEVTLKGFASPESPYAHNTDLAKGRTAALKTYISNLYHFPDNLVKTSYEPEDWEGLRIQVEKSALANRDAILALIDTKMDPDKKEDLIKKRYPEDYRFMLREWYPALRHTNYTIKYDIRKYTTPQEALRMVHEKPQNMDIEEFYLAAQAVDVASEEFVEIWETAVRLYPNDPVANGNAAATALVRHDIPTAERFLAKAGNTPEVTYSRGVLAVLKDQYDTAENYFRQAQKAGIAEATQALETLAKIRIHGREE